MVHAITAYNTTADADADAWPFPELAQGFASVWGHVRADVTLSRYLLQEMDPEMGHNISNVSIPTVRVVVQQIALDVDTCLAQPEACTTPGPLLTTDVIEFEWPSAVTNGSSTNGTTPNTNTTVMLLPDCVAGEYVAAYNCITCPNETFSVDGLSCFSKRTCSAGSAPRPQPIELLHVANRVCLPCPTNTYSVGENAPCVAASSCPAGTFVQFAASSIADTTCRDCLLGLTYTDVSNVPRCVGLSTCAGPNPMRTRVLTASEDILCAAFPEPADVSVAIVSEDETLLTWQQSASGMLTLANVTCRGNTTQAISSILQPTLPGMMQYAVVPPDVTSCQIALCQDMRCGRPASIPVSTFPRVSRFEQLSASLNSVTVKLSSFLCGAGATLQLQMPNTSLVLESNIVRACSKATVLSIPDSGTVGLLFARVYDDVGGLLAAGHVTIDVPLSVDVVNVSADVIDNSSLGVTWQAVPYSHTLAMTQDMCQSLEWLVRLQGQDLEITVPLQSCVLDQSWAVVLVPGSYFTRYTIEIQLRLRNRPVVSRTAVVLTSVGPPGPVSDVSFDNVTSSGAYVTWSHMMQDWNGKQVSYHVGVAGQTFQVSEPGLLLSNLSAYTIYNVSIQPLGLCVDCQGIVTWSEFRTLSAVPGPPLNVNATVLNSSSVILQWEPPTFWRGLPLGFRLHVTTYDGYVWKHCCVLVFWLFFPALSYFSYFD